MSELKDKVAIVTGASKGIGAAIARHLAAQGVAVVVNYASSKDEAEKLCKEIAAANGKAIAVQADMRKKDDVEKLFNECKKEFGRLDILINNAGVYEFLPLEKVNEEHYQKIMNLNVLGVLLACQESLKHFGEAGGSIVNISSIASTYAPPLGSVYSASKAAVDAITKSLAKELGPRKIRVNSVNPGMVETEGLDAAGFTNSDFRKSLEEQTPLGRIGKTDDIAPAVVFLASEAASWISGETWVIAGGMLH